MGTWHFWCYMREVIEKYCGKDFYKKNGEWITNHFAALISDEDMRSCCYLHEDDIRDFEFDTKEFNVCVALKQRSGAACSGFDLRRASALQENEFMVFDGYNERIHLMFKEGLK